MSMYKINKPMIKLLLITIPLLSILNVYSLLINEDKVLIKSNIKNITIPAIDSDYFILSIKNSTLPVNNIGLGVFSKANILEGQVICEYRGPIINNNQFHLFYTNNKLFEIQDYHGNDFKIIGTNICSYINDCTSVISNNYTINEFENITNELFLSQCFDNYSYNAKYVRQQSKVFIISIKDIKIGEEIFFSYGW